jgi:hypothetical protein
LSAVIVAVPGSIAMLFAVVVIARLIDLHELDAGIGDRVSICELEGELVALGLEGARLAADGDVEHWTFSGPVVPLRRRRPFGD